MRISGRPGILDSLYGDIPADDPFWSVKIGGPGTEALFDGAIYIRGAMTLHQLRLAVGDTDFYKILRKWAQTRAGGNVTTPQFIALAERPSPARSLDAFFTHLALHPRPAGPGRPPGGRRPERACRRAGSQVATASGHGPEALERRDRVHRRTRSGETQAPDRRSL